MKKLGEIYKVNNDNLLLVVPTGDESWEVDCVIDKGNYIVITKAHLEEELARARNAAMAVIDMLFPEGEEEVVNEI